ncbi:MAG: hypothetical protein K8W52_16795 [Deltaproteobacteria bacterium]|nr:hypothetical protein [Deltaproteobacteria bacterium]
MRTDDVSLLWLVVALGLVACGHAGSPAAPLENHATTPPTADAPFATLLDGPYESSDAYCDHIRTSATSDDDFVMCGRLDSDMDHGAPFDQIALMQVSKPDDHRAIGCVILIAVDTSWYATPVSADICAESTDVETGALHLAPLVGARGLVIDVDVQWHTDDYSDTADYKLTTLCGLAAGRPRCTPIFTSRCQRRAPAGDCREHSYQIAWSVAGGQITLAATPAPPNDSPALLALLGAHALGF